MKVKRVLKIMGNIIFYSVLIFLVSISFLMIKSFKENKQPTIMGKKFFTVLTGSMEPTIGVGDLVIAKETLVEDIKVGDIVTFSSSDTNNVVTHRIKEIINEGGDIKYVTQGDANNAPDKDLVESNLVIGKVVKWIPKVGKVASWMRSKLKLIIAVIISVSVIGLIWGKVVNKIKAIDKIVKKK